MIEGGRRKSLDTFIAASSLYQTLFNMKTTPPNPHTSIHVDQLKDWQAPELEQKPELALPNIICSFDYIFLIGWKYHEK